MTRTPLGASFALLLSLALATYYPTSAIHAFKPVVSKQAGSASALSELRQAVGSVAMVTSVKGKAVAFQQAVFSKINAGVKETAAGVQIELAGKRLLVLRNTSSKQDETEVTTYRYRGTDKRNQLVWVTKDLYEERKHFLISQVNGKQVEISNEPQLNLISTLVFAQQNECYQMFDDCYPGFQLWRINKGTLKLLKEVRLKHYAVVRGGWISTSTVRMEVASLQDMMNGKKVADMKRQFFDVTVR